MTKRTGLPFAAVAKTLNILLTFCKHFFYTECKLHDSKTLYMLAEILFLWIVKIRFIKYMHVCR